MSVLIMASILVVEKIDPEAVAALKKSHTVVEFLEWQPADLLKKVADFDVIVVRSKAQVGKALIDAGKKLKVIARAGAGLDNVDAKYAESKGIKVINTPTANLLSVAELTLGLALALLRHISEADKTTKAGLWEKKRFEGCEVSGKTWGIIGFGKIGHLVAGLLSGFKCRVIAYDPYMNKEAVASVGVTPVSFEELLKSSDIISIHVPLVDATRGMVGAKELGMMKKSAIIINTSRGGIVQEKALHDVLAQKKILGAALDVFEKEPPGDSPLFKLDNLLVTCHLGASTNEAQKRVGTELTEKLLKALV